MNIWDTIILQPMINILIALSNYLFHNFGLTIIILTIIIRAILLPLTMKQLRATKAMQSLQPKLAELQKKYAKDKQKLGQEQMKLYKESGVSATGCMIPMLIQMPIWIALYQSIMLCLAASPEGLLNLSRYLYSWAFVYPLLPLENSFLWLDLATGDTWLAILVGASMWVQQKMVTPSGGDPRVQQQSRMMLWMMPLMFTFLSLSFPSGLALYWVISNVITIVIQYYITGWGGLAGFFPGSKGKPRSAKTVKGPDTSDKRLKKYFLPQQANEPESKADEITSPSEGSDIGNTEDTPKTDRGGGNVPRIKRTRYQPKKGK
ncbi:YidC/Oxa1 family membrane protein insertase [Chloroflexota bacterium]